MQEETHLVISVLHEWIAALRRDITELKMHRPSNDRTAHTETRRRHKSQSRPRHQETARCASCKSNLACCRYHRRFGQEARRCHPPCSFIANESPTLDATGSDDWTKPHRLFITDKNTQLSFLIDTGANISVIPRRKGSQGTPTSFNLYAANNSVIPTFGEKTLELDLNLRRPYRWKFIIAAVSKPILGADFLKHHQILVDLAGRCLVDKQTKLSTRATLCTSMEPTLRTIDIAQKYHRILAEFPDVTRPSSMKVCPKHNVEHLIETTGRPLFAKARPIPPHRYLAVKKEFEVMMEQGLCRPSKSPWASPLHVVPKKNGDIRVCGDYRRLNAITTPDRYPVPRLRDFTYHLNGMKIFSTLDLNRAYQQLPVYEKHIEKTAIITPFGLFEFPRMCPGLKNAGQTFQRFIHQVLAGLDNVFPFVDDLIIASRNEDQHAEDLRTVLQRLNKFGITINPSKCVLGQDEVKFLGYTVSENGIKPPQEKIEAITNFTKPEDVEALRRFLGMLNFYRDSIPNAASLQAPLHAYLHNCKKKDKTKIQWTEEASRAYEACKSSISNAALLAHPHPSAPMSLMCDASDRSAGAVLQQKFNGRWLPLGYFSKKFSNAQEKYSTFDRELLAIYMAVKHFRKMFEGREIIIYTDHKPLTYALAKPPSSSETPRRTRQLLFISEFSTDIRHISGSDNVVADALSRIDTISCPGTFDYDEVSHAQEKDPLTPLLLKNERLTMKRLTIPNSDRKLYCETSKSKVRPYLPEQYRRTAFKAVHDISHPGIRATRKIMQDKYFWPGMNTDVGTWAKNCLQCQSSKVQRHTVSNITEFPQRERFEHLHIDIVGPLSTSKEGYRYLVTMIDRRTRWPEAVPVSEITAEIIAKTVYETWIARFGCPATLTSDQGRQFESQLFSKLTKLFGIEKIRTTAYHPQSNGIVERWHRSLKTSLMTRLNNSSTWTEELPTVLMGLRAAARGDTNTSPAELTYGSAIRLPGDFFVASSTTTPMTHDYVERLRQVISNYRPVQRAQSKNMKTFVHKDLHTCESVFMRVDAVRKPLQHPYSGPYRVVRRSDKYFTLQVGAKVVNVSIDRLKPAYILQEDEENESGGSLPQKANNTAKTSRYGRVIKAPVRFA